MLFFMDNGPFTQVGFSYLNDEVVNLSNISKICLKEPCKDYHICHQLIWKINSGKQTCIWEIENIF